MKFAIVSVLFIVVLGSVQCGCPGDRRPPVPPHNGCPDNRRPPVRPTKCNYDRMTVSEANKHCGDHGSVHCCDSDSSTNADGDVSESHGLLGGVLNRPQLFTGCSKLSVTVLLGINDLVNSACKHNVACCQETGDTNQHGLVNFGRPCIALSSLL